MTISQLNNIKDKNVFVTGHTGFKGSWLVLFLHHLGAKVFGYSLAPTHPTSLYNQIDGDKYCQTSTIGDIRDLNLLTQCLLDCEPDFVFHLAAQALVKEGYEDPIGTYSTNVMGTLNILEAVRKLNKKCVVMMVTTDKVYENPEDGIPFKEVDKLGGYDPYSSSKACDEILIDSYRRSYFSEENYAQHLKSIASVRAGNVIGGGDDAANRIIPDIIKAIENSKPVLLRNPQAVRPWQLVIEPLFAYILLAMNMELNPLKHNEAFNIGPEMKDVLTVEKVANIFIQTLGKGTIDMDTIKHPHEAGLLFLDNTKIKEHIHFHPVLSAEEAIKWTAEWFGNHQESAYQKCMNQINKYLQLQSQAK